LANRAEISVEAVHRLEPTFLVVRGRMAGTTDGGLLFLVPYEQLAGIYLTREVKESELQSIYAASGRASVLANGTQSASSNSSLSTPAIPSFGRPPEATSVARNNLLERLRAARHAAAPATNG